MDKPHYDPWIELSALRDLVRELADQGPIDPRKTPPAALASLVVPLDILDVGAALIIQVNLPGVEADNVRIAVKDSTLTVTGDVKPDAEYEGAVYLRRERRITRLMRTVPLPVQVEPDRAEASVRNGVLTIKLPKIPAIVPKIVKVQAS